MLQNNLRFLGTTFRSLLPAVPLRNVTIKTNQSSLIDIQPAPGQVPSFSRQMLRDIIEKPSPEEIRRMQEEQAIQDRLQRIYETKQNDRNPKNYINVKVNTFDKYKLEDQATTIPAQIDQLTKNLSHPLLLYKQPKTPHITVQGIRRKVPVSMKKLLPLMRAISGKHIYDAINLCMNNQTKAAKFIKYALMQVKRHAAQADLHEDRLFVSDSITGKHKRWRRVRYHAKGRGSMMIKDSCQLLIRLREKPIEDMFKDVIKGKFPRMMAYIIRKNIIENDNDYEMIRKNSFILTAKGRQQRRLMFKRQVIKERLAFLV